MDLDTRLTVPPHVLSRLVGEETVLLNLESGVYFGVDGVGKFIWDNVADGRKLTDIVAMIVSKYAVTEGQARDDVLEFSRTLVEKGLLVD